MLGWFQALLPKEERFFDLFEAHAATLTAGARSLRQVLDGGDGELVCCNEPMTLLEPKSVDEGKEKHAPVIEKVEGGVKVKIGSVNHPMEAKHFIEWIEVISAGKAYRQFLNAGQAPEAVFRIVASDLVARAYCNVHGLWKS